MRTPLARLQPARVRVSSAWVLGVMWSLKTMAEASRHDAWQAGDNYEAYMGRWSRQLAPRFLDWLAAPQGLDWLDVGCGTGALSAAILAQSAPASLISIDPSDGFIAAARARVADPRAEFRVGDAQALPLPAASRDIVVSALMLNFVPDKAKALGEMKRVVRPGGTIAFYVWDYPGGGLEFVRAFWTTATALDPAAGDLSEDRRFPYCTPDGLADLARSAGLTAVGGAPIDIATVFPDFDDYWHPFTLGGGPAPGYCASLAPEARQRLKDRLRDSLPRAADGSIPLTARAWAVRAVSA
jgi:SAM-dependent methyltransferase